MRMTIPGDAPEGREHWTLGLLRDRFVKQETVVSNNDLPGYPSDRVLDAGYWTDRLVTIEFKPGIEG